MFASSNTIVVEVRIAESPQRFLWTVEIKVKITWLTRYCRPSAVAVRKLHLYEAQDEKTGTTLIAMQPLVANQAYMPQMKAMCVPFHMVYGGFMCCQRLQSDRPKWRGSLAEVSQTSLCRTVSKAIQFGSEKWTAPAILAVTWLFLGVGQAIIPHLKEDIQGYLLI